MIVYLDSNVYIGAKYIFDKGKFATLRSLIEQGFVQVIYTSGTIGEVKEHLTKDIKEGVNKHNLLIKKEIAALVTDTTYGIQEIDPDMAVNSLLNKLGEFLNLDGVGTVSLDTVKAEIIMKDFFEQNAPFESKKPYEFKDAIMIQAIKVFQKSLREKIFIVSSDEGFRRAFDNNKNFELFQYIGKFIGYYQSQLVEDAGLILCITESIEDGIADGCITEYLQNADVNRGYYGDWECEDSQINSIDCEFQYIDVENGNILVCINVEMELSAVIIHRDEDTSYYDKEEGRYLIENYVKAEEKHCVFKELTVLCSVGKSEDGTHKVTDFEVAEDERFPSIDIDEDTMIGYKEIESAYSEDDGVENCSVCGKTIGRSLSGAYFAYDGSPVCEDCMTEKDGYEICPQCGRLVQSEHMISGFCDQCESDMD